MLRWLDILLFVFHTLLLGFNLFGWIPQRTRRAHLVVIGLTLCSWFILGAFWGWGYCPFTDWHWEVKYRLGERDLPVSYVKYHLDRATGLDWNATLVDAIVLVSCVSAFVASIWLNVRDIRRAKASRIRATCGPSSPDSA